MLSRIYTSRWGRTALATTAGAAMLLSAAAPASAASLTQAQISAVISLLQSFNVSTSVISNVSAQLGGTASTTGGTASSVSGVFIGLLHKGDNGKGVCFLHAILAADPTVSTGITASDVGDNCPFGSLTESALKHFQSKHGLAQVGFIGPKTLAALEAELQNNQLGEDQDDRNASSSDNGEHHGRVCAIVPPGHLIAPGWLRKHDGEKPVVPTCQTLPPGIAKKLGDDHHGTTTPPAADTTPPAISNISAGALASTTTTVTWSTNEAASSKVYYQSGSTIDLGSALTLSAGGNVTAHSVMLSSLAASTTYQYVVSSTDGSGNVATSSAHSLTTTN